MNTSISILSHDIRSTENLFCLNDLHKAAGNQPKHQPALFMRLDQTKELVEEIKSTDLQICVKSTRGNNGGTYVCKELVYSYAMWISAKFHLHVIRAFDALQAQNIKPIPQLPKTLTPSQKCHIKAIIAGKCKSDSAAYQTIYSKMNNHFHVAKYDEIPVSRYPEVCQFLGAKPLEGEIVTDITDMIDKAALELTLQYRDNLKRELSERMENFRGTHTMTEGQALQEWTANKERYKPVVMFQCQVDCIRAVLQASINQLPN